MAIIEEAKSRTFNAVLENGQTEAGKVKTVNVNIGALNVDAWDANKAYNIAEALAPCLSKELYSLESKLTSEVYSK